MAFHAAYINQVFRPSNDMVPGNANSDNPLEFDLVPAWGPDLARIKSIIFATTGLVRTTDWSPQMQDAVLSAFDTGAPAFLNTITAIRGLTVEAAAAARAGLILELPTRVNETTGAVESDPRAPWPVLNGLAFSRLAGSMLSLSMLVAMEIAKLSDKAERDMDPRNFRQPSGSGNPATGQKAKATNARAARSGHGGRATAARRSTSTGG